MQRRSFLALGFAWWPVHHAHVTLSGVPFQVLRYTHSNRRYLLIHGNEATARDLLTNWMYTHPGIAYLAVGKERMVEIMGAKIDPNRMYSRVGAEASLRKLNPAWDAGKIGPVLDYLDRHREELLKRLTPPADGVIIALHNNSEGYNVNEELADSDRTSIKQPDQPHEFFLCTDERDFELLAKSPYNVVLQNKKPKGDDGSLSRLAAARGFRYVNLETTLGQFEEQIARLGWLDRNLG
jgi:hypothetical protein